MIEPDTKGGKYDVYPEDASWMPEFTTAKEFAEAKIKMLKEQFYIQLSTDDILHLRSLKTETEINAAVRAIINKYWE
jgi:hypothetical protein